MLIPLYNPTEEQMYQMCQQVKDFYADGAIVGVYANYFCDGHWINHISKTVLKDNKVEEVDRLLIHSHGNIDWIHVTKQIAEFLKGVDCVINYDCYDIFATLRDNVENFETEDFDINATVMQVARYFRYRGHDVSQIYYARDVLEYAEGLEGFNFYNEIMILLNEIFDKYHKILEEDKDKEKKMDT